MTDLQHKLYGYFQHNADLRVLFVFDNTLMQDYRTDLDGASWDEGYQYVVFGGDWFTTKYKIVHEWQELKTILLFPNMAEPTTQEAMQHFPLLGALKANMAYKAMDYDAFIQQYQIPTTTAMFVQKHIQDLQRSAVLSWATPYLNRHLDPNTAMRVLLSAFLDQERLLSEEHILIRILLLAGEAQAKRDAFFHKLFLPTNKDVLTFVDDAFFLFSGQRINPNTPLHVESIVESIKYNAITQHVTAHARDPYGGYKIVNTLTLQHINLLITTAMENLRFRDAFLALLNDVGRNVRESKLIELYGAGAAFYYLSVEICLPILEQMAALVKDNPEDVLHRVNQIMFQFGENSRISGLGRYLLETAKYYRLRGAFRSVRMSVPDMYVDSYIKSVSSMDMAYRHAVGYYYTTQQQVDLPEYVVPLKQQLDKDYADFTNDLNLGWMDCIRQNPAGFGAVTMIGRQADFYPKMVKNCDTKQVVIISDALRYELAQELVQDLTAQKHIVTLEAMLASMPTETKYTKLTLFPHRDLQLAGTDMLVDGTICSTIDTRTELLNKYKPNAVCVDYTTVAHQSLQENRELFKRPLVYILHNTVDEAGHTDSALDFTQGCNKAIEELRRLILRLHDTYHVVNILVTSDHGFLFQDLPIEAYAKHTITDEAIERKTRYYLTESKAEVHGIAKFPLPSVSPMQSEKEVYVAAPCGTNRIATQGGGYQFAHGGMTLEEVIVPIVICRYQRTNEAKSKVGVALVSKNLSVVSSSLKIALVQSEAVDATHQGRMIVCALYAGEHPVTSQTTLTLQSADEELTATRMFNLTLTLNTVVSSGNLELRIYDKEDQLNPLIQQTVINQTLIERDEF